MIDFYYQLRQKMIDTMQVSLKQIRQVLGLGVQEFGDLIGLTRQTINNLETQKNRMSSTQYIAICSVIDNYVKKRLELLPIISTILYSNEEEGTGRIFESTESGPLLRKWFMCFPDNSDTFNFSFEATSSVSNEDFCSIAENYRVFLDQTALTENGFSDAVKPFASAMKSCDNKFIVPLKVIEALQHQLISSDENDVRLANRGLKLLMHMQNDNLLDIRGEKTDVNVINTFVSVFAKFKCVNRLAVITCDAQLAEQITALNNDTLGGFNILVLKYSEDKGFQKWEQEDMLTAKAEQSYARTDSEELMPADSSENELRGWETIN